MKTYYQILGVPNTATTDEIKKQYRKLANEFHPDKNNGDKIAEEKFKELGAAYGCLSDPDKRANYDQALYNQYLRDFQIQQAQKAHRQRSNQQNILENALLFSFVAYLFSSSTRRAKKWTKVKRRRRW